MGRTAHRSFAELLVADAIYLGDVAIDAAYLGEVELYTSGPSVPVIYTTSLNAMEENVAFSQQISRSGNPTPTFTVSAGTLPTGITVGSGGLVSGTPTVNGAYDFTVTATNTEGTDVQQYTGTITAATAGGDPLTTAGGDPLTTVAADQLTTAA